MPSSSLIAELELRFITRVLEDRHERHPSRCVDVRVGDGTLFRCPSALLCEGSVTLSERLEDMKMEENSSRQMELTLPAVDSAVFHAIALYLEHFCSPSGPAERTDEKESSRRDMEAAKPTPLSRPARLQELYHLSDWEHSFVVQQLLVWPRDLWELSNEGRWVDESAKAINASSQTMSQCNISHLLAVLEAATTLGMPSLRDLCAAVFANVLMDLDEKGIMELMGVSETFGPEEEKALLKDYPWLNM